MKRLISFLMAGFLLCACSPSADPFEEVEISLTKLEEMIDDQETFVLLAERDECPYCAALDEYLASTAADHDGLKLYRIDTTDFGFYREGGSADTLVSDEREGKDFLDLFPYFLYTPALFQIRDGLVISTGVGFNEETDEVSEWDVDSSVRFEIAEQVDVWSYIEQGQ